MNPTFTKENIDIVSSQTGLSEFEAIQLLEKSEGDPVNAIMLFMEPSSSEEKTAVTTSNSFTNKVPEEIHQLRQMLKEASVAIEKLGGEKAALAYVSRVAQHRLDLIEEQMNKKDDTES